MKIANSHTFQLLCNKGPPNVNEQWICCIEKVGAAPPRVTLNSKPNKNPE